VTMCTQDAVFRVQATTRPFYKWFFKPGVYLKTFIVITVQLR